MARAAATRASLLREASGGFADGSDRGRTLPGAQAHVVAVPGFLPSWSCEFDSRHPAPVKALVKGTFAMPPRFLGDSSPRSGHYAGHWVAAPPTGPLSPSLSLCVDPLGDDGF